MKTWPKARSELIRVYGGKVYRYRDLPAPACLALAHYMAFDGEAWEAPPDWTHLSRLASVLPWFTEKYGGFRMGYIPQVPSRLILDLVWAFNVEVRQDFDSVDEYHHWYVTEGGVMPRHSRRARWPSILAGENDPEVLQDGWHRFHAYVEMGMRTVPLIYYPD